MKTLNARERTLYLAGILSACGSLTIMEAVEEILSGLHGREYRLSDEEKTEYEITLTAMVG